MEYCCELKCFFTPRIQVDGRACRTCGSFSFCSCRCMTYTSTVHICNDLNTNSVVAVYYPRPHHIVLKTISLRDKTIDERVNFVNTINKY